MTTRISYPMILSSPLSLSLSLSLFLSLFLSLSLHPLQLHETDGVRNRRFGNPAITSPPNSTTTPTTVIAHRKLSSDSTVTELTLVGDEDTTTLPLERRRRRKKRHSPPTSQTAIREESDVEDDEVDMDSLLDEIKLDDFDNEEGNIKKEKKERSPEASAVTVVATVHGQVDTIS